MGLNKRLFSAGASGLVNTDNFAQQNYTGTSANRTITTGFRPAAVLTKTLSSQEHPMIHSSTNSTANSGFYLSLTNSQYYNSTSFTGFADTGYTLGTDSVNHLNANSRNYTSFAWKGNGTSSLVTNTDGDVTSYTDANPDAGFSTVRATGTGYQTVGHGLNSAPEFFWQRSTGTGNLYAWHKDMGEAYQNLNTSSGGDISYAGGVASAATTVKFLGSSAVLTNVYHCWHSVDGYSKVSSYTGTGSSASINLGFQPRMVWLIPNGSHNIIFTSLQVDGNGFSNWIYPNITNTLYTGVDVANGIKLTSTGFDVGTAGQVNNNNAKYYYLAFA